MGPAWLAFVLATAAAGCAVVAAVALSLRRRARRRRARESPVGDESPVNRPLEVIAYDVRRLGARFRNPPRGTSFAKFEASRYAYDRALLEACTALEVDHLLGVLPPGEELDTERHRVESVLWLAGLRIEEAA